jgi:hypothetical protein
MVHTKHDNTCIYGEESLTNLFNFINGLSDSINTNLFENLSGRKISDLNHFKLDFKNRLNERARIRDTYLNLTMKEREYNLLEWNRTNEPTISISLPAEMLPILPYLKYVISMEFYQEGITSTQKEDNNINISIDVMAVKEYKFKKPVKEMANNILPLLENVLKTDHLKTNGKVPSRKELESFLEKMKSETDAYISDENIEKKKAELKKLSLLRNENVKSSQQLKAIYPFLNGEKINQISRDFNLLTIVHYLEKRQKWVESSLPPKDFTDCSDFELN